MIRKIIKIDQDKCNGCGLCVSACHEGAIGMENGKAKLLRDDYCDGLGDCLPACPTNAITFEQREALAYDEEAVKQNMAKKEISAESDKSVPASAGGCCPGSSYTVSAEHSKSVPASTEGGCPGSRMRTLQPASSTATFEASAHEKLHAPVSQLRQWPVQIKLVAPTASFFEGAHLLIAADCTAYAYANFHNDFMKNKITIIGCPKLDEGDYTDKLTSILTLNNIKSVTVARMEVPCCGGLANATVNALRNCGKMIPWNIVTIASNGVIVDK